MLIPTTVFCALRCPGCGCLEAYSLSLFGLGGGRSQWIECSCGTPLLGIVRQKGKGFWLQLNCIMCGASHFWIFSHRELWGSKLLTLTCEDTGLEVGFLGTKKLIWQAAVRQDRFLAELAQDLGLTEGPSVKAGSLSTNHEN
ncbi:MAG: hypothetical protein ACPL5F_05170 [Moorellaceae bacterium]